MKQPILDAKLAALRSYSPEVASWIDRIPLQKWTQAYDGGSRFGHMTTNLAECMNSVLKRARSLPICALIKATFERTATWFVERGVKADSMLRADHQYIEEINAIIRKINNKWECVKFVDTQEKIMNFKFKRCFLHMITAYQCLLRLD